MFGASPTQWTTAQGAAKYLTSTSRRRRLLGLSPVGPGTSSPVPETEIAIESRFWIERIGRARVDAVVRYEAETFQYTRVVNVSGSRVFVNGVQKAVPVGDHMMHSSDVEGFVRASQFVPIPELAGRPTRRLGREAREYQLDPHRAPEIGLRFSLFAHANDSVVTVDVESGIWLGLLLKDEKEVLASLEMISLTIDEPFPSGVFELPGTDEPAANGSIISGNSVADVVQVAPFRFFLPVLPGNSRVSASYVGRPSRDECEVWIHIDLGDFSHYVGMSQRMVRAGRFFPTDFAGSSWSRIVGSTEVVAESNLGEEALNELMGTLQPVTT
jgi:hypothetical protein